MAGKERGGHPSEEELKEVAEILIAGSMDSPAVEGAIRQSGLRAEDVAAHVLKRVGEVDSLAEEVARVIATRRAAKQVLKEEGNLFTGAWQSRTAIVPFVLALVVVASLLFFLLPGDRTIGPFSEALSFLGLGLGAMSGFLLQLPRLRRSASKALAARESAYDAVEEASESVVENAILPEVRQRINELVEPPFNTRLAPLDVSGLKKLFDPEYEVPLKATELLQETLESLEAGSVAIAGPRGVGKTTIIKAACDGRLGESDGFDGRGLLVSAPVRYGGQEFIHFLFAQLCMTAIEPSEEVKRWVAVREANRTSYRNWLLTAGVSLLLGDAAVIALGFIFGFDGGDMVLPLASLAAFMLIVAAAVHRWPSLSGGTYWNPVEEIAEGYLERLRFLETFSEERTSGLAAKGAKLTSRRGVSRASLAWTLPEVIHHYRNLAGNIATQRPLLIGIDELDKMASPEDARSFLNEMKPLFDQPGVFYLVSISEDALSDFERRGQPIRDVFDSVFSEVLHLRYLNLAESTRLLARRAIGVPPPWPALFHSLAGGLPRESLRVARSATRIAIAHGDRLQDVCLGLVAERVSAHEHATSAMAQRDVGADGSQPILSWLRKLPAIVPTAGFDAATVALQQRLQVKTLVKEVRSTAGRQDTSDRLERLVVELAADCYHSLTCLEFFPSLTPDRYERACTGGAEDSSLGLLARAHQDLSAAPRLAWETLDEFRERENLKSIRYPV